MSNGRCIRSSLEKMNYYPMLFSLSTFPTSKNSISATIQMSGRRRSVRFCRRPMRRCDPFRSVSKEYDSADGYGEGAVDWFWSCADDAIWAYWKASCLAGLRWIGHLREQLMEELKDRKEGKLVKAWGLLSLFMTWGVMVNGMDRDAVALRRSYRWTATHIDGDK